MKIRAMSRSRRSSSRIATTSDWVETSRAVVGSSASRTPARTRERRRSSPAGGARRRAGAGTDAAAARRRGSPRRPTARSHVALPRPSSLSLMAIKPSVRKSPIVRTGLMCTRGSWKIIAISRPGTTRSAASVRLEDVLAVGPGWSRRLARRAAAGGRWLGQSSTCRSLTRRRRRAPRPAASCRSRLRRTSRRSSPTGSVTLRS